MTRTATSIIAIVAVALAAAACSGTSSRGGAGGSTATVAFAACMRSHGVPGFPDPDSNGNLPKVDPQQLGVSTSQFDAAQTACAHLLQPSQAQEEQEMSGMLAFAHCMRSHGVPGWPDPTTDASGPIFDIPGIDPNSPQVSAASDACLHLLPQPTNGHPRTVELCNGIGEDGRCHGYGNPNG